MSSFEFPITDQVCPPIGQGFDLISGVALDHAALGPPGDDELSVVPLSSGNSHMVMTQDTASYTSAIETQLDIAGSGWGCSVGLSLSESSFSASQSNAITINLDAFHAAKQAVIDPRAVLRDDAMTMWKTDRAGFNLRYGDYFVAGYIYGKRCSLAYCMKFQSEEEKDNFSAALSASYSGVDFSASMDAAIKTAKTSAQSSFVEDTVFRYAGFEGGSPGSLADVEAERKSYEAAPASDSKPIKLIVMPWSHLDTLDSDADLSPGSPLATLNRMIDGLGYVTRSCAAFLDGEMYAGHTQLTAVKQVLAEAQKELDAIIAKVRAASKTGVALNDADVALFDPIEPLVDSADTALRTFALAFKVHIANSDDDCNNLNFDRNGQPFPPVVDRVFDGSAGVDLTWSIAGNDSWAGTKGTTKMAHIIARPIHQGGLTANIMAVIDRETGTLQIWRCGVNETLDQNQRSPEVKIRGKDNSLACDDPHNTGGVVRWVGDDGLVISAAVF